MSTGTKWFGRIREYPIMFRFVDLQRHAAAFSAALLVSAILFSAAAPLIPIA